MLFDVVADIFEEHDVAAENPGVVAKLLARLQQFNSSHCAGERCLPDNAGGPKGTPVNDPDMPAQKVWLPWRGDPSPAKCDTDRTPPPPTPARPCVGAKECLESTIGADSRISGGKLIGHGWCFDMAWDGGRSTMIIRLSVDGTPVATQLANITRPGLPTKKGPHPPNAEHGFDFSRSSGSWVKTLGGAGKHRLDVDVFLIPSQASGATAGVEGSPLCFANGKLTTC
jgi:hypothetical protein